MNAAILFIQTIRTPRQLDALVWQTYLAAVILAVVTLAIVFLIAQMIPYEGGSDPTDAKKRRLAYVIIGLLVPIGYYLYNLFATMQDVAPSLQDQFGMTAIFSSAILLAIYLIVGFVTAKLMSSNKFATIFSTTKR